MNAFIERHCIQIGLFAVLIGGIAVNPHLQMFLEAAWMVICSAVGLGVFGMFGG